MSDSTVQRLLKRITQVCPFAEHISTLRKRTPSARSGSKYLTQTSTYPTGLPSSSQFAATFLLGWTRGGSPGIFG